ncbi:Uncharacterized protein dnm_002510 [Desulfonema magnum]|uniref:Uncharacterized protein n=1 Tax=Desulfonema magnum TaxID=45655 RepID=A0A975BF48_9BACT|nr:Uncharacterized protein dnm_002510 [Desulfonema magnum]
MSSWQETAAKPRSELLFKHALSQVKKHDHRVIRGICPL